MKTIKTSRKTSPADLLQAALLARGVIAVVQDFGAEGLQANVTTLADVFAAEAYAVEFQARYGIEVTVGF
jgi:hypothetical protein